MTDKTPVPAEDAEETAARPPADAAESAQEPGPAAESVRGIGSGRTSAPGVPAAIAVSPGVHKRLTTGLGGFTMAMGACLLLVLVIYMITPRSDNELLPTVDYSSQEWAMRQHAPYTAYAPEGLPPSWRPTSSRLDGLDEAGNKPVAWHLGFVTPSNEYAALEQSNEKASEYIPRMTNNRNSLGTQQVNGVTWTKYHRKDKKANSLARTLPDGVSLVVTGTASYEELAILAASLKPLTRQGATPGPSISPAPSKS